jgi:hypothetical protein
VRASSWQSSLGSRSVAGGASGYHSPAIRVNGGAPIGPIRPAAIDGAGSEH